MTTVYTFETHKDAWSLVSHFLGNDLLAIGMATEVLGKLLHEQKEKTERIISDARAQLIGNLYMLVRNMNAHGHADDAANIQQILDMVTDQDVTKAEVREAIHDKNHELNVQKREFDAVMADLRARGAFQK